MKKSPKSMVGISEQKGNAPRYYGDTPMPNSSGKQLDRGKGVKINVSLGKIPNLKAKSFK